MRIYSLVAALGVVGLVGLAPATAVSGAPRDASRLFTVHDPQISEASGLTRGIRNPDVFYVQNDSGHGPQIFAIDRRSGQTRSVYDVPGAQNVDWEDIASGIGRTGRMRLWIADTGDNNRVRNEVRIYGVDEPAPGGSVSGPDVWRLRYPKERQNAEALLVEPGTARLFLVTKTEFSDAEVYAVPPIPDPDRVQTLRRVASLPYRLVTGGAVALNGERLALRTYSDAYVWQLGGRGVVATLQTKPRHVSLPAQPLGEGIAVVGNRLIVNSEQVDAAVYALPIPTRNDPIATPAPSGGAASGDNENVFDRRWVRVATTIGGVVLGLFALALLWSVLRLRRRA